MAMTLESLATELHEKTGATGAELEEMTLCCAMIYADFFGVSEAGDHFARRCQEATARRQARDRMDDA